MALYVLERRDEHSEGAHFPDGIDLSKQLFHRWGFTWISINVGRPENGDERLACRCDVRCDQQRISGLWQRHRNDRRRALRSMVSHF